MAKLVEKLKMQVIYPLVVSALLQAGCATTIDYRNTYKTQALPHQRITFVEKDPQTLDDLMAASKNVQGSLGYVQEFNRIKRRIRTDSGYNPGRDIKSLVYDIESSNLENKHSLASVVKEFSYYKEEEIGESTGLKADIKNGLCHAIAAGAALSIVYLLTKESRETETGYEFEVSGTTWGEIIGLGLVAFWAEKGVEKREHKKYNQKTLVKPYYGKSSVIERN